MAKFRYTAKRMLVHEEDDLVELSFDLIAFEPEYNSVKTVQRSLSGNAETLFVRHDIKFSIATGPVPNTDRPQWEEFLASVSAGETFEFELDEETIVLVELLGDSWRGNSVNHREHNYEFELRVIEFY